MIFAAQRFVSAAAIALVLGLLGLLSKSEPFVQGQPDCTVTVQLGQSIQSAIDAAPAGAVICNGVTLANNGHLSLIDSSILRSADWGLTAISTSCRYGDIQVQVGGFTGQVNFQGMNKIEGNNISGYLNGMGNPGNHPWNRPNVPDGQVCLP